MPRLDDLLPDILALGDGEALKHVQHIRATRRIARAKPERHGGSTRIKLIGEVATLSDEDKEWLRKSFE